MIQNSDAKWTYHSAMKWHPQNMTKKHLRPDMSSKVPRCGTRRSDRPMPPLPPGPQRRAERGSRAT
jgi:hypothetical protein